MITLLKYAARSAESISTVTVLPEAIVSIPTPAAISNEESRRFTEPVPVSAVVLRTVLSAVVPTLSTKPEASTVKTGIAVIEPYVPAVTVVFLLVILLAERLSSINKVPAILSSWSERRNCILCKPSKVSASRPFPEPPSAVVRILLLLRVPESAAIIPVTVTPVLVVSNFLLPLWYKSTEPDGVN